MTRNLIQTKTTLLLSVLAVGFASLLGGCETRISDKEIVPIDVAELKRLADAPNRAERLLLIDPRASSDFEQGHIPNARNMPITAFSGRKNDTDPSIEKYSDLVVYGDNPASTQARAVVKRMMATGYKNVRLFVGGLSEWRAKGFPVEQGKK